MRDDFRSGFIKALDARIRNLHAAGKRVILTGDLNVSRDERDSASAEEDNRKTGVTHEEYISTPNRRIFNALIEGGEVIGEKDEGREQPVFSDLCREFHPDRKGMYTHWNQKINARPGNFGGRIDFILSSISMRNWFSGADIQEGLLVCYLLLCECYER
jgi:AP endonuclease-2